MNLLQLLCAPARRDLFRTLLEQTNSNRRHYRLAEQADERADLVIISFPEDVDRTLDHLHRLSQRQPDTPILVEVPANHPLTALQAFQLGASDCLKTPVAPWEWLNRIDNTLAHYRYRHLAQRLLQRSERRLHAGTGTTTDELLEILHLADAFHDEVTGTHEQRTARLAAVIAAQLGLAADEVSAIESGARLHDIGKIGIPDAVLNKPGAYDDEDRRVMHAHPMIGFRILCKGESAAFRTGAEIALSHHERMDGTGYPNRLRGESIPLAARIVAVADVFEALVGDRHYRTPISVADGMTFLRRHSGDHFDPACVAAMEQAQDEVSELFAQ